LLYQIFLILSSILKLGTIIATIASEYY